MSHISLPLLRTHSRLLVWLARVLVFRLGRFMADGTMSRWCTASHIYRPYTSFRDVITVVRPATLNRLSLALKWSKTHALWGEYVGYIRRIWWYCEISNTPLNQESIIWYLRFIDTQIVNFWRSQSLSGRSFGESWELSSVVPSLNSDGIVFDFIKIIQ